MSFFFGLNLLFMALCNIAIYGFDSLAMGFVFLGCQVLCLILGFFE